jgi:transcriptional regulator with XRE-family HTH domain
VRTSCVGQPKTTKVAIMGRAERARDDFRNKLRTERKSRNLSQADLAKLLEASTEQAWHPTTIAKIEAGERSVRIDEAAAIADLFELSLDGFLGRRTSGRDDMVYAARALSSVVSQAHYQLENIERNVRDRADELDALAPSKGWIKDFAVRCAKACDKVREAGESLDEAVSKPSSPELKRFLRRSLMAELQKEEREDEA